VSLRLIPNNCGRIRYGTSVKKVVSLKGKKEGQKREILKTIDTLRERLTHISFRVHVLYKYSMKTAYSTGLIFVSIFFMLWMVHAENESAK
jgi:hypothetical protein